MTNDLIESGGADFGIAKRISADSQRDVDEPTPHVIPSAEVINHCVRQYAELTSASTEM